MINPEVFWVSEEQIRATYVARAARDGKRKAQEPRKTPKVNFLQFSTTLLLKLTQAKASGRVWAMVCALTEAWFTTGLHSRHPNPFPLSALKTKKWGFNRSQKYYLLRILVRMDLVRLDRSDPKNPFVTINWEPPYP
jgi:hypothetical protein